MFDIAYGVSFDPLEIGPAVIALVVGLIVWRRHRVDRRARLFLALAISELAFSVPALMTIGFAPTGRFVPALLSGLMMMVGMLSAILFFHFGMAFPHARPWLRRDRMKAVYLAAVFVSLVPLALAAAGVDSPTAIEAVVGGVIVLVGPLAIIGAVAGCMAVYRSYREMTADERRLYRAPVLGVLFGMIAGIAVDLVLGTMFALMFGTDNRRALWTANLLATAAALLLPLFFFMAAMKYRLLEHHSQDYVSGN